MGTPGLATRKTCTPEGCVHWTMGMVALATLQTKRPAALVNIATIALILIAIISTF